jgi:proteasome lid subunit RPN8/RPN11
MDADIQFGELEESAPEVRLRPDQDRHFAVVPCHHPEEADLPIFVDVDVMCDIEQHALTNTHVELGGVLLGGQFHDDQGNPFVLITDSLRAEHYEATKGSFKFTHETWEAITRQRDEFSDDLQMVGWYHTHPDWGVFLSTMDMFICDHFFNRLLDVALVVDPCRDDRGWFQWTRDSPDRVRRTGGFYLIGSRFREAEIQSYADLFGGNNPMSAQVRRPIAGQVGSAAAPIVNISDARDPVSTYFLLGFLGMQFLLLALIAWKMLAPDTPFTNQPNGNLAAVSENQSLLREQGRQEVLQTLLSGLDPELNEKFLEALETAKANEANAVSDLNAQRSVSDVYASQVQTLEKERSKSTASLQELQAELAKARNELGDIKVARLEQEAKLAELEKSGVRLPIWQDWKMWVAGFVLCIFSAVIGFGAAIGLRKPDDEDELPSSRLPGDRVESPTPGASDHASTTKISGINFQSDEQ